MQEAAGYEKKIRYLQKTLNWPQEEWKRAATQAEEMLDRLKALEKMQAPVPQRAVPSPQDPSGYKKLAELARAYGNLGAPGASQEYMNFVLSQQGIGSGIGVGRMKIPKPKDEKEGKWPPRKGDPVPPMPEDQYIPDEKFPEPEPEAPAPPPPEKPVDWEAAAKATDNLFFDLLMEHIPMPQAEQKPAVVKVTPQPFSPYKEPYQDDPNPDWTKEFAKQQRLPNPGGVNRAQPGQIRATLMYPSKPGQIHLILPEAYAVLEWPAIAASHPPVSWITSDEWELKGAWPMDKQITFVSGKPVKVGNHLEVTYVVKRNA